MKQKLKIQRNKGFTLIELVVTISIMIVLTSALLLNFGTVSKKRNLVAARNMLVSDLRKAQSFSLSARDISPGVHSSAYGISFDMANKPNSYMFIAEDNASTPNRVTLSTVNFPTNVHIQAISVQRSDGTFNLLLDLTALFKAPYGRILQDYLGSTKEIDSTAIITLSTSDDSESTSIILNGVTGNIETQ